MNEQTQLDEALTQAASFPEFVTIEKDTLSAMEAAKPFFDAKKAVRDEVFDHSLQVLFALGAVWLFGGAIVTFGLLEGLPFGLDMPVPKPAALTLLALAGMALGSAAIALVRARKRQTLSGPVLVRFRNSVNELGAYQSNVHALLAELQNGLLSAARAASSAIHQLEARLDAIFAEHVADVKVSPLPAPLPAAQIDTRALTAKAEDSLRAVADRTRIDAARARLTRASDQARAASQALLAELDRRAGATETAFRAYLTADEREWIEGVTERDRLMAGANQISQALDSACTKGFDRISDVTVGGRTEFLNAAANELNKLDKLRQRRLRVLNVAGLVTGWLPIGAGLATLVLVWGLGWPK